MAASSVLTIGQAQKAAGDVRVRLPCDFGDDPMIVSLLLNADGDYDATLTAILGFNVTCTSDEGLNPPLVTAKTLDFPYVVSGAFSGGDVGTFNVAYSVSVNNPDLTELVRTGILQNL